MLQALGVGIPAAQKVLDSIGSGQHSPSFIAQGNLAELVSQPAALPSQFPKLIHRFPLLQNIPEVRFAVMQLDVASQNNTARLGYRTSIQSLKFRQACIHRDSGVGLTTACT